MGLITIQYYPFGVIMSRLPKVTISDIPDVYSASFHTAIERRSGFTSTIQTLFAHPSMAQLIDGIYAEILESSAMEPWIVCTVGLTVSHELDNQAIWEALLPLAREVGVRETVIDAIYAGTAPRGLLPKEGIWAHFSKEILGSQVRDSTWQAITHLVGNEGAITLSVLVCYYEMMCRLNATFGLKSG